VISATRCSWRSQLLWFKVGHRLFLQFADMISQGYCSPVQWPLACKD